MYILTENKSELKEIVFLVKMNQASSHYMYSQNIKVVCFILKNVCFVGALNLSAEFI